MTAGRISPVSLTYEYAQSPMHSWRNLEPKTIAVVVTRAQGLRSERASKSHKCKFLVTFCHGKKKQSQTTPIECQDGCPVFNTEARLKVSDISEPLVLIVSDKDYHCGQVIVPTGQIKARPEDCEKPRDIFPETWHELEPTKKQSHPQGHLQFSCWVDELRPISSGKEKGLKGFLSKVDLRRNSSSRGSITEVPSVSTPHLLIGNSSNRASGKSTASTASIGSFTKPKAAPSPLARFKLGHKKKQAAPQHPQDLQLPHHHHQYQQQQRGFAYDGDDARSSISGQSIDDRFSHSSSFSSRGGGGGGLGRDPFAGTNPFSDYPAANNPFGPTEEDTTDLDALTASVPSTPAVSRHRPSSPAGRSSSSSAGSNYSLDAESRQTDRISAVVLGRGIVSVEPLEAPLEGGTMVCIEGRDLASGREEIASVYLGDCELKEENIQFVTSSKIKVYTRRWYNHRGPIHMKTTRGTLYFDKEFVFSDPNKPDTRPNSRRGSFSSLQREAIVHSREPSLISDVGSVSSRGRYRKAASRNPSNASRSMFHLPSASDDPPSAAPKIKTKDHLDGKSPAGSWSKGMVSRLNKSFSDLTQPFLHKKKSSLGSQNDLAAAFGSSADFPPPGPHRTNSAKKPKASACAARIERKGIDSQTSTTASLNEIEAENKRLVQEVESLKKKIASLEMSNEELNQAKKDREEFIDRLQAKLLEANCFEFLCIDSSAKQNGQISSMT